MWTPVWHTCALSGFLLTHDLNGEGHYFSNRANNKEQTLNQRTKLKEPKEQEEPPKNETNKSWKNKSNNQKNKTYEGRKAKNKSRTTRIKLKQARRTRTRTAQNEAAHTAKK